MVRSGVVKVRVEGALRGWLSAKRCAVLGVAGLAACGTVAPTVEPPDARALPPVVAGSTSAEQLPPIDSATPSASATALPELPPLPAGIELAAPRACKLQTASFRSGGSSTTLRLTERGAPFARFDSGGASLSIPNGDARAALLETNAEGIVARGFVDAGTIVLRPTRAFVMGGFVVPNPSATLSFTSANDDGITVALEPAPGVHVTKKIIEEQRPCGDVGFDRTKYETKTPVFGTRAASTMQLRRGPVALMAKPTDKLPVAILSVPEGRELVLRYFIEKDRSLISWEAENMLVFGWVSSQLLREVNGGRGSIGGGSNFARLGASQAVPVARLQCDRDVPVIAQVKDVERTVGHIAQGTIVRVLEWGSPRSRIELLTKSLIPERNARFFARTPELERCKRLPGV